MQRHNGWSNSATKLLAEWIVSSPFAAIIRDLGDECIQAADDDEVPMHLVAEALQRMLAARIPKFLRDRLRGELSGLDTSNPASFIVILAHESMGRVDWEQLATHWAGNCMPMQFDDLGDDEQPGNFAG